MKKNRVIRLMGAMLFTSAIALPSSITLTLQNSVLNGSPGSTLTLVATALNNTTVTQNLNSDSFSLTAPLTLNDSLYFNNWPLALNGSQTFGPQGLFTVFIPLTTTSGMYGGVFNIVGGPGVNDQLVLGTAVFQVNVSSGTATPEPATAFLLLIGGALIPLARRYQRRVT